MSVAKSLKTLARQIDMKTSYLPPFQVLEELQRRSKDGRLAKRIVGRLIRLVSSENETTALAAIRELKVLMGVETLVTLGLKFAAGNNEDEDDEATDRHAEIAKRFAARSKGPAAPAPVDDAGRAPAGRRARKGGPA